MVEIKIKKYWRLGAELILLIGFVLVSSLYLFTLTTKNQEISAIKSEANNTERQKIEETRIKVEQRAVEGQKLSERRVKLSALTELLTQSFKNTYEVSTDNGQLEGMEAMFAPTVSKPYQRARYECLDITRELATNQDVNLFKKQIGVDGELLLWCSTDNKILTVALMETGYPAVLLISKEETPRIIQQRDILSRGNLAGNIGVSMVDWKRAPEIDEEWFTFEFSEYSKTGNVMWEPNTTEKYLYYWQTPGNLQLREYCLTSEYEKDIHPDDKPTTTCYHVAQSPRPVFGNQ